MNNLPTLLNEHSEEEVDEEGAKRNVLFVRFIFRLLFRISCYYLLLVLVLLLWLWRKRKAAGAEV